MLKYIKISQIFIATLLLVSCDDFVFDNPVDRESLAYMPGAADTNEHGVINYLADDNGNGVPNYRDPESDFFSQYHVSLENRVIESRQNYRDANDGTLKITLTADNPMASVYTGVDFRMIYKHVSEIERIQFDYYSDGTYNDSIMFKRIQRQHTYREKGVYDVIVYVRDRMGNVDYDTTTVLIYDVSYVGESEPPVINLLGDDTVFVSIYDSYEEAGFNVVHNELDSQYGEGFLNSFVLIDDRDYRDARSMRNPVMTEIYYYVYDTDGNYSQATRFVKLYRP